MKKTITLLCVILPVLINCVSTNTKGYSGIEQSLTENTVRISIKEDGDEKSTGSGFLINYKDTNYVITNFHVIGYNDDESIVISKKNKNNGFDTFTNTTVIIQDPEKDLAVLSVPGIEKWGRGLTITNERYVLEPVVIPGFPPHAEETDITFSAGKISNPKVVIDGKECIKLDIAVSPGNSGGPLVNENQQVLGIVHMKITRDAVENVAYAIPINKALELIDSIENHTDEKIVKKILTEKTEKLFLFIQFYNADSIIPVNYFTHEYNKSFKASFFGIYYITNLLCEEKSYYSLISLPEISTSLGKALINDIYDRAENVNLFDLTELPENNDEYETMLLIYCYKYIRYLIDSLAEFKSYIETQNISDSEFENIFSTYSESLIKLYTECVMTEMVMQTFKNKEIDSFKVVDIQPVLDSSPDKCSARIFIKIRYEDSLKNLKIQAAYSRGRWGISSITSSGE